MGLISSSGKEIVPPADLEEGEGLLITTFDENISYDEGGNIIIARSQLDSIVLNILMQVIQPMRKGAAHKINQPKL